jgi:hypothetical protein
MMNRSHAVIWSLSGLLAGTVGWLAGALLGSNMGRTVLAATATAVALGLLARRPRLAAVAGTATAATATLAFLVGRTAVTPLIAWPVAGLAIGLSSLALLQRTRARVTIVVVTPLLGSLGFLLGMVGTAVAGMAANNAIVVGQFLWGGATGFGLLTLTTVRILGARLDRVPVATGGAS